MKYFLILLLLLPAYSSNSDVFLGGGERLKEGDKAPELAIPNLDGDTVRLSSLKGHVVLVDFWASWCHPCREVAPKIVALYKKYHERNFENGHGFEIYSVSLDDNPDEWFKAINEDQLVWRFHVSERRRWNSKSVKIYQIGFVPNGTLIDGDGKIIAANLDYSMIKYYLKALVRRK